MLISKLLEFLMKSYSQEHYESIEKALKEAGFKVDKIVKQRKKTVITVFHTGENTAMNLNIQRVKNE